MGKSSILPIVVVAVAAVAGFVLWTAADFDDNGAFPRIRQTTNDTVNTANTNATQNTNTTPANANTNTNSDQTTDWQSYENTELGFGIELPPGWSVDQTRSSDEEIVWTDGLASEVREAVKSTVTSQTLVEWSTTFQGEEGYVVSDYTLDGQVGKRVRLSGIGADYIGVKKDGRLFVITVGRMEANGMLATLNLL